MCEPGAEKAARDTEGGDPTIHNLADGKPLGSKLAIITALWTASDDRSLGRFGSVRNDALGNEILCQSREHSFFIRNFSAFRGEVIKITSMLSAES